MKQISLLQPSIGLAARSGQFWATMWTELIMQWRRWGLWLAFGGAWLMILLIFIVRSPNGLMDMFNREHFTLTDTVNYMVFAIGLFTGLVFPPLAALLVSDRLVRDKRLAMSELQRATPQSFLTYTLGKFVGNYLAMLIPALLACLLFGLGLILDGGPPAVLPALLLAFVLIFMPVFAVVIALALFLSSLIPLRALQIGFPLLWLYSVLSPLGWITLNNTVFNPKGKYIYPVFFPTPFDRYHPTGYTIYNSEINIAVLLATALVSLLLLVLSLERQARKDA